MRNSQRNTGNLSTKPKIVPTKSKAPEVIRRPYRAEGVHPPVDLDSADTAMTTASVNPSVDAAEQVAALGH